MADKKPEEPPKAEQQASVTDEETRAAFAGPAFHSNKMYLSVMASGARIAFMEQLGDTVPPVFRTAVILSYSDVIALRDLITRQIKFIEEALKLAATGSTKEDGD